MSFSSGTYVRPSKSSMASTILTALAFLLIVSPSIGTAQEGKRVATDPGAVSRGKYIVEDVAMCGNCHTPRLPDGEPDRSRTLVGGPVPYLPARPVPDWPILVPRIGGLPPASDAAMITLLTTGIWTTGRPLRDPMPRFHMTRADAEAVLAYLKSMTPGQ